MSAVVDALCALAGLCQWERAKDDRPTSFSRFRMWPFRKVCVKSEIELAHAHASGRGIEHVRHAAHDAALARCVHPVVHGLKFSRSSCLNIVRAQDLKCVHVWYMQVRSTTAAPPWRPCAKTVALQPVPGSSHEMAPADKAAPTPVAMCDHCSWPGAPLLNVVVLPVQPHEMGRAQVGRCFKVQAPFSHMVRELRHRAAHVVVARKQHTARL